jgi:phosphoribosylanthranilate isomerase
VARTRVKICGIARPEDAALAAHLGADAIGLVFHPPAPRNVSVDRAKQILAVLPPFITPVALFVNADTRLILEVTEQLRIRHVQLHGHESPDRVAELRGVTIIKAVRVQRDRLAQDLAAWRDASDRLSLTHLAAVVLETADTKQAGGSGVENDWATIAEHRSAGAFSGLPPLIAAGGLRPDNVAHVVRTLRPYAVDVSSGVESFVGHKSEEKLRAFIEAVHTADPPSPPPV